jgi:hypothetical protein
MKIQVRFLIQHPKYTLYVGFVNLSNELLYATSCGMISLLDIQPT